MRKIIAGNWKMHGDAAMAKTLAAAVAHGSRGAQARVVVCPPAVLLAQVAGVLSGSGVATGGQDCHFATQGAYTGDISATMLKDAGCEYVIVGHSERREQHGETNELVCKKTASAIAAGLIPIICIGETAAQRAAGQEEDVVGTQVRECLPKEAAEGNFVLAYEPVWAIGSGKTATEGDIARMHAYIGEQTARHTGLPVSQVAVLYGGSVNAANAKAIMALGGVSGVLVGGASLKEEDFCKIIASA